MVQVTYIMRFKVGENVKEGSSAVIEEDSRLSRKKNQVNSEILEASGKIIEETNYSLFF